MSTVFIVLVVDALWKVFGEYKVQFGFMFVTDAEKLLFSEKDEINGKQ